MLGTTTCPGSQLGHEAPGSQPEKAISPRPGSTRRCSRGDSLLSLKSERGLEHGLGVSHVVDFSDETTASAPPPGFHREIPP
jgi:hypothetical protein